MRSELADCFQQRRKEQGLGLAKLARMVGYQNITKGSNKIGKFEQRGCFFGAVSCLGRPRKTHPAPRLDHERLPARSQSGSGTTFSPQICIELSKNSCSDRPSRAAVQLPTLVDGNMKKWRWGTLDT